MKTVTDVRGYTFWGAHTGVKSKRRDLGMIFSDVPASAACVFTKNIVKAEPIKLMEARKYPGKAQAIVVNSGNANACTGREGKKAAEEMIKVAAEAFGISEDLVIIASTGVIGRTFPIEKVTTGIKDSVKKLTERRVAASLFANAILTTDTFPKEEFAEFKIGKTSVRMGGVAKGSGMIHPNMGTMLGFVVSDIAISPKLLDKALKEITEATFNMITVDGDTSTNDMVAVLCNGAAGNEEITEEGEEYELFKKQLHIICENLAKLIVSDGEGSTKFIEYIVKNARNKEEARKCVRTISNSALVKTAIFGRDPNWGRIIAAAGRSGAQFDPEKTSLTLGTRKTVELVKDGQPTTQNFTQVKQMMRSTHIRILLDLNAGDSDAIGWGSDFSYEYVRINAEYTT